MKRIFLTTLFIMAAFIAFCQQSRRVNDVINDTLSPAIHLVKEPRFLINVHKGYSVGMGSTFKFYPDDISSISVIKNGNGPALKTISYANPTKGLGDGFKMGFGISYILNDFINIGIDFDHFNSTIRKYKDSSFRHTNITNSSNGADEYRYNESNVTSYTATLSSFTPNITFKAISKPRWFLYNKLGAIVTFRPNSLQEDKTVINSSMGWRGFLKDSSSTIIKEYEWSIRNPAFGFMAALGGQIKLGGKLRGFAEMQFSHIVFVIRKKTLTEFYVDNNSLKSNFPVSMRELEFVPSFSLSSANTDPNKPSQTIIQRIPITYLGLQLGLALQL